MGRRLWIIAALAAVAIAAGACAPLPQPSPAFVVTTMADTFDGVCDEDCSLRDAIAASNASPAAVGDLPNRITLPTGTVVLDAASQIQITEPVILSGSNADLTTLDVTGSSVPAPDGIFDTGVPVIFNTMTVLDSSATADQVLVSCSPGVNSTAGVFNVDAVGLAATISRCHATLVNAEVTGADTALTPRTLSVTSSTIPVTSTPLDVFSINIISSTVTGAPGTVLTVHPSADKVNIPINFTGTRFEGVGLEVGAPGTGTLKAGAVASSFDLGAAPDAVGVSVAAGSELKLSNSTVYGGDTGSAFSVEGSLVAEASTITTSGTAVAPGAGATVSLRRSVVSGAVAACSAPVTSLGNNAVVGATCGAAEPTDQIVADEASLELGPVERNGNSAPSLHRLPGATSPLVDAIAAGDATDADCPVDNEGAGQSLDARGIRRPQGPGCDVGSLEVEVEDVVTP